MLIAVQPSFFASAMSASENVSMCYPAVFFPRLICPYSGSEKLEWRVSKGRGTVYATTIVHPAEGAPFNVALVDCDEGFRLMSRVEDVAPDAVKIGMRVKFRVHKPGGENDPIPVFTPEAA